MIKLEKIFVLLFLLGLSVRMSAVGLDKRFQILPLPQQMEIQKGKGISAGELSFVTMKGEGEIPVLGNMLDALPRYAVKGVKGVTLSMTEKDVPVSPEGMYWKSLPKELPSVPVLRPDCFMVARPWSS